MSDSSTPYTPFKGKRAPEPPIEMVRVLWRYRGVTGKLVTAAIYRVLTGLELRVDYHGDVRETQLSRTGEGPLTIRADALRAVLEEQGWTPAE